MNSLRVLILFFAMLFLSVTGLVAEPVSIAVDDLVGEGVEASEARIISDRLRSELLSTGLFRVMERGEMERVLKEQGFQNSGACTDQGCLVEVGQLLGVSAIIAGRVGKIGGLYTIGARMIDIRTGEILFSLNVDCKCGLEDVLRQSTKQVAHMAAEKYRALKDIAPPPGSLASADKTVDSSEKRPLLKRGAFWIPVGVLVAGGGAAALLLSNDTPPSQQDTQYGSMEFTW